MTNEETCISYLCEHFGLEQLRQSGEMDDLPPDHPAVAKITLIRSVVRNTLGDLPDTDERAAGMVVGMELKFTAAALATAADALFASASSKRRPASSKPQDANVPATSPPVRPPQVDVSRRSDADFQAYLEKLEQLAAVLGQRWDFGFRRGSGEEAEMLAKVFECLGVRRHTLRAQRFPTANPDAWHSLPEELADDGDEIVSLYHTILDGTEFPERPENWSLRGEPDTLRETLQRMLVSLKHLADAAEINWQDVMSKAEDDYRKNL